MMDNILDPSLGQQHSLSNALGHELIGDGITRPPGLC